MGSANRRMKDETDHRTDHIRRISLSLAGVAEVDHWGRPAFRTARRIFAVIRPDGLWLYLPEERKEFLFEADPKAFVKFMWGKHPELIAQPERLSEKNSKPSCAKLGRMPFPPRPKSHGGGPPAGEDCRPVAAAKTFR